MNIFGPQELLADVHGRGLCVGCGACVNLCPYFKTYKGKTSMIFPCDLSSGHCFAHCPKVEVDLDELANRAAGQPYEDTPLGGHRRVVAARAGGRVQGSFQAGGTVTALMTCALEEGLIDAAVLTGREGLVPSPRLITRPEEVALCAGSKYTAAPTLAALNQAVRDGYRRLGVVATPCQATALTQLRANPLGDPDFEDPVALVVGLFCTWALDTRQLMAALSQRLEIDQITKMDIPPPPAEIFVVETGEGVLEIPLSEIRPLVPYGCLVCPDMTAEWADVSVGVLEDRPQWNTLIVRTAAGEEAVEHGVEGGYLSTEEIPKDNLTHLEFAAINKKKRALVRAEEEGLLNTAEQGGRSTLRIRRETVQRIKSAEEE